MGFLDAVLCSIDNILDTKRKRHILGGMLISASFLFAGFAATVMTIAEEEKEETEDYEIE